jgi:hypothetical protein
MIFTDERKFLNKMIELIPLSANYEGFQGSRTATLEYYSIQRIIKILSQSNLNCIRNSTNKDTIDLIVNNDIYMQAKYAQFAYKRGNVFSIVTVKSAGYINGKQIKQPYSISDPFQYLIVEVGGTKEQPELYHKNLWICPKVLLIKQKILKSSIYPGKTQIQICRPDYEKDHWSKQYWFKKGEKIVLPNNSSAEQLKIINRQIAKRKFLFFFNIMGSRYLRKFISETQLKIIEENKLKNKQIEVLEDE